MKAGAEMVSALFQRGDRYSFQIVLGGKGCKSQACELITMGPLTGGLLVNVRQEEVHLNFLIGRDGRIVKVASATHSTGGP